MHFSMLMSIRFRLQEKIHLVVVKNNFMYRAFEKPLAIYNEKSSFKIDGCNISVMSNGVF